MAGWAGDPRLSSAQLRYLTTIVHHGSRRYNGRARLTLEALRRHGLITFTSDLDLHARSSASWTLTAEATDEGRAVLSRWGKATA